MLIYLDRKSAEYLLMMVKYHKSVTDSIFNVEICVEIIKQIEEGLKDYV